jgi:hypothetical protein
MIAGFYKNNYIKNYYFIKLYIVYSFLNERTKMCDTPCSLSIFLLIL